MASRFPVRNFSVVSSMRVARAAGCGEPLRLRVHGRGMRQPGDGSGSEDEAHGNRVNDLRIDAKAPPGSPKLGIDKHVKTQKTPDVGFTAARYIPLLSRIEVTCKFYMQQGYYGQINELCAKTLCKRHCFLGDILPTPKGGGFYRQHVCEGEPSS